MSNQGLKIKLDIRKKRNSTESKFMMIMLGPQAKKISDLVNKVRLLCPRIQDVKVYQEKYLLPHDEDIGLINTEEDVIIIPIASSDETKRRNPPKRKVRSPQFKKVRCPEVVPTEYIDSSGEE